MPNCRYTRTHEIGCAADCQCARSALSSAGGTSRLWVGCGSKHGTVDSSGGCPRSSVRPSQGTDATIECCLTIPLDVTLFDQCEDRCQPLWYVFLEGSAEADEGMTEP